MRLKLDDTIAAIATPLGAGGLGVIRISGPQAMPIACCVFRDRHGRRVDTLPSHRVRFGSVVDPRTGDKLDEVLLTYMRAPHSYTCEDVVEISAHGGIGVMARILAGLVAAGARVAEPGEFTKRAFLNGRLDLAQAEAVIDLIQAQTEMSHRQALMQLEGGLSQLIAAMREDLLDVLAHVEGAMEFPEEDLGLLPWDALRAKVVDVEARIAALLSSFHAGRVLREGVQVVIVGRPNVGKSSLFNALLAANRAIVTPIPGTTRDILEEVVNLRGYPFRLVDTAGIRSAEDVIEREGIERARSSLEAADLVLLVLDRSEALTAADAEAIAAVQDKRGIVVLNKADLPANLDFEMLTARAPDWPTVAVSCKECRGLDQLSEAMIEAVLHGQGGAVEGPKLTKLRHWEALHRAQQSLQQARQAMEQGLAGEFIAVDLRETLEWLGEIIGLNYTEDLLDKIFSEFCIGK
ncbi:MAG TPA: tRNA uridine-5-carboxymethylaminomethyl(34) synthesis GTPase MnmE [Alphaproteobacteria bacterium]|nr:tRNA uridine-5-carboxymethylaminomethyl(34) synthesis GTPase MnmE [Alphaproteobacteria bacterium]